MAELRIRDVEDSVAEKFKAGAAARDMSMATFLKALLSFLSAVQFYGDERMAAEHLHLLEGWETKEVAQLRNWLGNLLEEHTMLPQYI